MGGRGSGSGRSSGGGGLGSSRSSLGGGTFKEFSDMPLPGARGDGTYDYGRLDPEQRAWFGENSNYNELINSMNANERAAFENWSTGYFMAGQQYKGFGNLSRSEKNMVKTYDKYLDQATVDKNLTVVRLTDAQLLLGTGHKGATLGELQRLEGKTITSKTNLSFAAAKQGLQIGDTSKNVELKLGIPGGTKGAGMYIADGRVHGWGARQREFMSNRDVQFKVGKTTYNASRNVFEVEISYAGRLAHDYGH